MRYTYKKATLEDITLLIKTRVMVLRAANNLTEKDDMALLEQTSRQYYKNALATGDHTAYLVFDGEEFIGTGGVSFYQVMPTYHNPSGQKAYIMNMYTAPAYRGQGVASKMLHLLVSEARHYNVSCITLEATAMGIPICEKYGFIKSEHEYKLPEQTT